MEVKDIFENNAIVEAFLEESYGEVTPEIEEMLNNQTENVNEFIAWAIPKIKEHQGIVEAKKAYAKEITDSAKSYKNKADNLKSLCDKLMQMAGTERVETVQGTAKYIKSKRLEIIDEALIPKEYKQTTTNTIIITAELKKALKDNDIPGAVLTEHQNFNISGK